MLITKFLMPTTSSTINTDAIMYTEDMSIIQNFDWGSVVYKHLRESAMKYQARFAKLVVNPPQNKKSRTIPGCMIMLLVSIQLFFSSLCCF